MIKNMVTCVLCIFVLNTPVFSQSLFDEYWFSEDKNFIRTDDVALANRANGSDVVINSLSVCVIEILQAQRRYNIPDNILLAIGLQESGKKENGVLTAWPWTVNSYGKGRYFKNKEDAMDWVRLRKEQGIDSNDVGCMQINLRWHPDAFNNLEDAFKPRLNVEYAAKFLTQLYRKTGDWFLAAGSYHSFTKDKRNVYLKSLKKNIKFADHAEDYFINVADTDFINNFKENEKKVDYNSKIAWNTWKNELGSGSIYANKALEPVLPNYDRN